MLTKPHRIFSNLNFSFEEKRGIRKIEINTINQAMDSLTYVHVIPKVSILKITKLKEVK